MIREAIGKRLIVRSVEPPTLGSIYMPEDDTEPLQRVEVVAVGEGFGDDLKPGDHVLIHRNAAWEIRIEDEPLLWVAQEHVLAKYDDDV